MITGFNNDVQHAGCVYHVQTEDKGEASAWIESLIYVGGRILARKRVTYKQLLENGADKPAIAKLMERQHRLMIQQVRDGRFDEDAPAAAKPPGEAMPPERDSGIATARMQQQARALFGADRAAAASAGGAPGAPAAADLAEAPGTPPAPPAAATGAAERTGEGRLTPASGAPTLDQVIFDYLSTVAREESLVLLMDESPALASATTTRMDLGTHASRSGKPVANAEIAVRMISKIGRPVTLAEGRTAEDGTLSLTVAVPSVPEDSAALIISATSHIGSAEIKHLL
ncbi:MAG: hypothetical protein OEP45_14075 [Acidobacteriota bacterium]|nr:hypothetical protein [Acidobacteriota bacterium]